MCFLRALLFRLWWLGWKPSPFPAKETVGVRIQAYRRVLMTPAGDQQVHVAHETRVVYTQRGGIHPKRREPRVGRLADAEGLLDQGIDHAVDARDRSGLAHQVYAADGLDSSGEPLQAARTRAADTVIRTSFLLLMLPSFGTLFSFITPPPSKAEPAGAVRRQAVLGNHSPDSSRIGML